MAASGDGKRLKLRFFCRTQTSDRIRPRWAATVTAIAMYVSYLDQIALNLSGHRGSIVQPLATVVNCALWLAYGFGRRKKDQPIIVANIPGVILGAVALFTAI
jgi:uncharacterized protein with PQ loop repeat